MTGHTQGKYNVCIIYRQFNFPYYCSCPKTSKRSG